MGPVVALAQLQVVMGGFGGGVDGVARWMTRPSPVSAVVAEPVPPAAGVLVSQK